MVNTTHLMAFQEAIEETNVFLNANDDYQVPRTKRRRVEYEQDDAPHPIINKSQDLPKFHDIKQSTYIAETFNSLLFFGFAFVNGIHMTKLLQHLVAG